MLKSISLPAPPGTISWSGGRMTLDAAVLLLTLLAYIFCGPILRQLDATAAPFDAGLLSALAFAAAAVLTASLLARLLTAALAQYAKAVMVEPLNLMKPWQHLYLFLGLFCLFFCGFMLVLIALL